MAVTVRVAVGILVYHQAVEAVSHPVFYLCTPLIADPRETQSDDLMTVRHQLVGKLDLMCYVTTRPH